MSVPRRLVASGLVAAMLLVALRAGGDEAGGGRFLMGAALSSGGGFVERSLDGRRYEVFVPEGEPPAEGWPVVLFLHGAGERGTDGHKPTTVGLGPAVRARAETFAGMVVFPQAEFADGPILETWRADAPAGRLAQDVLAAVEGEWPIDPARRAITGWSMGAYGALSLAADDPDHFSKVLAVSGGGEPGWGPELAKLPVWLVHGEKDVIVPASESRAMMQAVPEPHELLTLTEVAGAEHDVWRSVYDNAAVLDWLTAPASEPPDVDISAPPPVPTASEPSTAEEPFAPALMISRAVSLRLGNEALATIAGGIPASMNERGLTGELPPVEDRVEFEGRTFEVSFAEMSYAARLERAVLRGDGPDRLRISFALKNFEVRIGEVHVGDGTDEVTAGPVTVVIGHREPVWMVLEVRPIATPEGTLRLSLLRSRFAIPDHNWFVEPPERIEIRGGLFSEEVVTTAIVGGVYQRRGTIETQILAAVEPMLREVEQRADFSVLAELVTALWPLPVYEPRLQMRLEETSTDRKGVSLVFGCAAAGLAPLPAGEPVPQVTAATPPAYALERSTGLQAGVAVDVLQHLSALLAGTDATTLYAADVPGRPFQELDDANGVVQGLGDAAGLSEVSDVRTRMSLREPFAIVPLPSDEEDAATVRLAIDVPRLSLSVFGREDSEGDAGAWRLLANRELSILQPLRLDVRRRLVGPTDVGAIWDMTADVYDFTPGPRGDRPNQLTERFRQGWSRWAEAQQGELGELPDVSVGSSTLRLDGMAWEGECLTARFRPAATVLVNERDVSVKYCIRSDASRWSDVLSLAPGERHVFRSGVELQVRDADVWSPGGQRLEPGEYVCSGRAGAWRRGNGSRGASVTNEGSSWSQP